jgi:hypothetical protein
MKTMIDNRELLSALIDGEAVNADAIAGALEVPANRALLIDFVRLRASVRADEGAAPEWPGDGLVTLEATGAGRRRAWLRAAAVVALVTAGALGGTWVEGLLTRERPPEPTRVVQLHVVNGR